MSNNLLRSSKFELNKSYQVLDEFGNKLHATILDRSDKWVTIRVGEKLYPSIRVNKVTFGCNIESIILEGYEAIFSYQVDSD